MHISWNTFRRIIVNSAEYFQQRLKVIFSVRWRRKRERTALIDLDEINVPRRLNQICRLLRQAGYGLMVRVGWRDFIGFNRIGRESFRDPDTFLVPGKYPPASLLVTDSDGPGCDAGRDIGPNESDNAGPAGSVVQGSGGDGWAEKMLRIDYNFYPPDRARFKENCYIPIMFHPALMTEEIYARAAELSRNSERRVGVMFAGSLMREQYNRDVIRDQYGLFTRNELIDAVESWSELRERVYRPGSFEEFEERKNRGELTDKIVIIDTRVCRIPQERWLEVLSEVAFFIAAPGISMPFCHNLPESMAVGAIPVIQFGDLLYPPLEDRKTCAAFGSLDELKGLISKGIPYMSAGEIEKMRKRVVEYHRMHLSPESFISKMREFEQDTRGELRLIMARRMYTE